jgi:signal transduction histidine kinase
LSAPDETFIWLAGELHDNIGQRLAMLAIELGMLKQRLAEVSPDLEETVARLAQDTAGIGSEVHRLAKGASADCFRLQHGLEEAIRRMCDRLSRTQALAVNCDLALTPRTVPPDVALALVRIGQEALHNIIKHSHANRVSVMLDEEEGAVVLRVVDDGRGFDAKEARNESMLGIASMIERAHAVGGQLTVASAPGCGTSIEVRVPMRFGQSNLRVPQAV